MPQSLDEISAHAFYQRLVSDPIYPKTAQPTAGDFAAAFDNLGRLGAEAIVYILISADMSGTLASATQTAKLCNLPALILDARGPSLTIGWQVLAAAPCWRCTTPAGPTPVMAAIDAPWAVTISPIRLWPNSRSP